MAELIDTSVFRSQIFLEGSWGARDVGEYESTMELYFNPDNTGFIEWSIPDADLFECIGLWFESEVGNGKSLVDYDGVMSLNQHAIALLRRNNIFVSSDFE